MDNAGETSCDSFLLTPSVVGVQGPFRGCKGTKPIVCFVQSCLGSLYDGGHRVPFIVSWPGKVVVNPKFSMLTDEPVPAGRIDHSLLGTVDWLPTIASIAGKLHFNLKRTVS